jgi:hypothetical protein
MTLEGTHRENIWSPAKNTWRDIHYYAILEEEEWRGVSGTSIGRGCDETARG